MAEPTQAAILGRAKQLADRDGFDWQTEFTAPAGRYAPKPLRPYLSDEEQQEYLRRARAELEESGDA